MAELTPRGSIVVDPARRQRRRVLAGTVVLTLLVLSFSAGRYVLLGNETAGPVAKIRALERQVAADRRDRERLEQQLTNARMGSEVDRRTIEAVRQEMMEQQQESADLREEIAIYKGLLMPGKGDRGLSVRSWSVSAREGRRFHYRLVVQQLENQHAPVRGDATVTLLGVDDAGKERSIPLREVSRKHKRRSVELNFTYFQVIDGELDLPADFTPQRVQIAVHESQPRPAQIEKRFPWEVQEKNAHVGEGKG